MQLGPDNAAAAVERHPCPQCEVPAGSACRTRAGKTAAKYHTARFILVPALRDGLTVPVPADRGPGRKWTQGPEVTAALPETTGTPIRVGYARCSTSTQELQSQLDALAAAHCTRVFSEKISTRIKIRPELEKAVILAHEIKAAAPGQPVILAVHEMKRLARNAAELMTLSARLQGGGVQLELLSGPLTGVYDPHGMGSMLFAVLGVACEKVKYPTLRFCGAMACGCRGCGAGPDSRHSSLGNAIPWSSRWLTGTLFGCDTESVPALP